MKKGKKGELPIIMVTALFAVICFFVVSISIVIPKLTINKISQIKTANVNAAVTVMAYGLRPAMRKLNSENEAIKIFKAIYSRSPEGAEDWDTVRAIAYSGAKR